MDISVKKIRITCTPGAEQYRRYIKEKIESLYGIPVRYGGVVELGKPGENGQCDSLKIISETLQGNNDLIWIVDQDLGYPGCNFVFGLASTIPNYRVAVISTYRLSGAGPHIVANVAAHEVGHLFGLSHHRGCIMEFSPDVDAVIQKPGILCEKCQRKVKTFKLLDELDDTMHYINRKDMGERIVQCHKCMHILTQNEIDEAYSKYNLDCGMWIHRYGYLTIGQRIERNTPGMPFPVCPICGSDMLNVRWWRGPDHYDSPIEETEKTRIAMEIIDEIKREEGTIDEG